LSAPAFAAQSASYRYDATRTPALDNVTLTIPVGSFYAFIGPNGSGKSTLLKLLLGALRPTAGVVSFGDRPSAEWDRRTFARRVGVVAQIEELLFPFTVREFVMMGRYPHLGPWQQARDIDEAAVTRALERCDIVPLAERTILQLSGGERQRARLARALAQEPEVLVLDEPTAALDISHEMAVFELLADLRRSGQVTIVAATHNINLAARYATHILLLQRGSVVAQGDARAVIEREQIESVYGWPVSIQPHAGPGSDAGLPQVIPLGNFTAQ
jgi:iron complex transport system ATP-binding protein